ncbi:MAG: head-tail adaptor protein [Alphaproteobacteria bacterium]|nr:head-tail adaptor protein [Alphaproteobacteria bacterium]
MRLNAGDLDQRVRFERKVAGKDSTYGTPVDGWVPVRSVWAQVQDVLPSRSEKVADGIAIAARPVRIRFAYRRGINSTMRVIWTDPATAQERILQIVGGPATLGNRDGIEIVCEDYSTAGDIA